MLNPINNRARSNECIKAINYLFSFSSSNNYNNNNNNNNNNSSDALGLDLAEFTEAATPWFDNSMTPSDRNPRNNSNPSALAYYYFCSWYDKLVINVFSKANASVVELTAKYDENAKVAYLRERYQVDDRDVSNLRELFFREANRIANQEANASQNQNRNKNTIHDANLAPRASHKQAALSTDHLAYLSSSFLEKSVANLVFGKSNNSDGCKFSDFLSFCCLAVRAGAQQQNKRKKQEKEKEKETEKEKEGESKENEEDQRQPRSAPAAANNQEELLFFLFERFDADGDGILGDNEGGDLVSMLTILLAHNCFRVGWTSSNSNNAVKAMEVDLLSFDPETTLTTQDMVSGVMNEVRDSNINGCLLPTSVGGRGVSFSGFVYWMLSYGNRTFLLDDIQCLVAAEFRMRPLNLQQVSLT